MIPTTRRNLILLKLGGAWKSENKILNACYRVISVVHGILHLYAFVGCIIAVYVDEDLSMEKFSLIMFTVLLSLIVISRLFHTLYYHDEIEKILQDLETDFVANHSIKDEEVDHLWEADDLIRRYSNFNIGASFVGASVVCAQPLFEKLLFALNLPVPANRKDYPFPIYVPFDDSNRVVYCSVYVSHVMTSFAILYIWVGSDILFVSILVYIVQHFKILGGRVRRLKMGGKTEIVPSVLWSGYWRNDAKENLMQNIKRAYFYHDDLIKFCTNLERIFSLQLFQLLVSVTALVCACGFQVAVGTVENASHMGTMSMALLDIAWYWFVSCLFGSWIQSESTQIANDLYSAEWINFPKEHKKMWQFMIARAQKPITFRAGNFVNMTLTSFVDMVKMSYSFIAILRQMYFS